MSDTERFDVYVYLETVDRWNLLAEDIDSTDIHIIRAIAFAKGYQTKISRRNSSVERPSAV